jgi:hypothetical protein
LRLHLVRGSSGAEQQPKLRPDLLDDQILRRYAHGSKRPGYLLQSVRERSLLGRALERSKKKWLHGAHDETL